MCDVDVHYCAATGCVLSHHVVDHCAHSCMPALLNTACSLCYMHCWGHYPLGVQHASLGTTHLVCNMHRWLYPLCCRRQTRWGFVDPSAWSHLDGFSTAAPALFGFSVNVASTVYNRCSDCIQA